MPAIDAAYGIATIRITKLRKAFDGETRPATGDREVRRGGTLTVATRLCGMALLASPNPTEAGKAAQRSRTPSSTPIYQLAVGGSFYLFAFLGLTPLLGAVEEVDSYRHAKRIMTHLQLVKKFKDVKGEFLREATGKVESDPQNPGV